MDNFERGENRISRIAAKLRQDTQDFFWGCRGFSPASCLSCRWNADPAYPVFFMIFELSKITCLIKI
jgi:hypothetical protein